MFERKQCLLLFCALIWCARQAGAADLSERTWELIRKPNVSRVILYMEGYTNGVVGWDSVKKEVGRSDFTQNKHWQTLYRNARIKKEEHVEKLHLNKGWIEDFREGYLLGSKDGRREDTLYGTHSAAKLAQIEKEWFETALFDRSQLLHLSSVEAVAALEYLTWDSEAKSSPTPPPPPLEP